uniref:Integrin, alpha 10 n=1 Tax=Sphaeramia orbicularis TaxID=375764 RepID=A0A672Y879_9TELE
MELRKYLLCLEFILLLKELCQCFNIDVTHPRIFTGPEDALFGFSVLQHESQGEKLMLVGAPWDGPPNNRKGDVYKCIVGEEKNSNCSKVNLGETALQNVSKNLRNSHLGMTLTPDSPDGFLACAPLWSQECGTSMFSTGICASVSDDLEPRETIAPTAQRCSTYMDIVIVLDGSNSIYPWYEVQNFLSNILSKFHISSDQMQVGILQYGEIAVHEWSLKDYQTTQEVVEAAKNISRQEGRETRTAYAIHMACTEAFSTERGAREGATKVMIVVTDGESHDGEELADALDECDNRNITRYAIAVLGHYIRRQQDPETFISEIKYIASDPDDKYFFNVTDEAALNDIVDALGDRIFTLEGTLGYNESSFHMEMSQIGFSTHTLDDGILFGMVGAYDWDGGVLKEGANGRIMPPREAFESEFPLELKNHAAYLGYTVSSVIVGDWRRLYVAGAPRFKHKGKVILFELSNEGDVNIVQALNGEQIGSYYGSEVCGLDIDQDGITDVLLVAAPMFLGYGNKEAGRVYIYSLSGVFVSNGTLKAEEKSQDARFGYALASAPDLNQDGFTDLLVGAPLEDDHRGAIYVYHGDGIHIIHNYKQRIPGSSISPSLQYFGRSVSARLDLDGDQLIDLAVGAQGSAVVLSSRSIVQINVSLSFQPHSINVIQKTCQRGGRESACLNATACFTAISRSPGLHSNNFAMLDDRKSSARALFDDSSHRQTQLAVRVQTQKTLCYNLPFHVYDTADYIRPISFSLRFKINDTESGPVLDEGWPTTLKKYIPFFKDCGEDDVCTTDLVLNNCTNSGKITHIYLLVKILCFVFMCFFFCSDSNLNRYEVHPTRSVSEGIGPEFYTHLRLQNLGCYSVSNVELRLLLPSVAAGDTVFMTVTDVSSYNVSTTSVWGSTSVRPWLTHLSCPPGHRGELQRNCSRSWCTEVVCEVQQLLKGQAAVIRVSRRVHDDFFRNVRYTTHTLWPSFTDL